MMRSRPAAEMVTAEARWLDSAPRTWRWSFGSAVRIASWNRSRRSFAASMKVNGTAVWPKERSATASRSSAHDVDESLSTGRKRPAAVGSMIPLSDAWLTNSSNAFTEAAS